MFQCPKLNQRVFLVCALLKNIMVEDCQGNGSKELLNWHEFNHSIKSDDLMHKCVLSFSLGKVILISKADPLLV